MNKSRSAATRRLAVAVFLVVALTGLVVSPVAADAPSRPRSVVVKVDDSDIQITWRAPSDAGDEPIFEYQLRLQTMDNDIVSTVEVAASARSATFPLPVPDRYRVRIRAVSEEGRSRWVSRVVEVTGPPTAPRNVRVVEGHDGSATVRWAEPTSDGGDDIVGYEVSFDGQTVDVGRARRAYRFANVDRGEHTVAVRARNENGFGPVNTASWANIVEPGKPRSITSTVSDGAVTVSWSRPADDGGEISGYDVEVGGSVSRVGSGTTRTTISGLEAADFSVRVRAVNRAGRGQWASGADVSIRTVPGRPRNVTADVEDRRLVVSWASPIDDGNSPVTQYRVRFGTIDEVVTGTTFSRDNVPSAVDDVEVSAINQVGEGSPVSAGRFSISRVFEPFDSSDQFVNQMYADFLGRGADRAGLSFWQDRLTSADDMAPMVVSIARAPELDAERRLARLYLALFDRAPDRGGFDYWVAEFEQGRSLPSISEQFVSSQEFLERFGALSNAEFVVLVYNRVLARQPDQSGFSHWVSRLDAGAGRGELISLFAESPEFVTKSEPAVDLIVTYDGLLQRPPQHSELVAGLSVVSDTGSVEAVIAAILAGGEYRARVAD